MKTTQLAATLLALISSVFAIETRGNFKIDVSHYAAAECKPPSMEKGAVEYQDIIKNETCRSKDHPFRSLTIGKHQAYWGNKATHVTDWSALGVCDVRIYEAVDCQGPEIASMLDVTQRSDEEDKECIDLGAQARSLNLSCDGGKGPHKNEDEDEDGDDEEQ